MHVRLSSFHSRAQPWILLVSRIALGLVFLVSSIPKLRRPYDFIADVYDYQLVAPQVVHLVGIFLPWLELILALCLVGGVFVHGSLLVSCLALLFFVAIQCSVLCRGMEIDCGCFGFVATSPIGYGTLLRTLLLFAVAFAGFFAALRSVRFTGSATAPPDASTSELARQGRSSGPHGCGTATMGASENRSI